MIVSSTITLLLLLIIEVTLIQRVFGTDEETDAQFPDDDNIDENSCSTEPHTILDSSTTCCNHTINLQHGIDLSKYWKECAVTQSKAGTKGSTTKKAQPDQETYVDSTRRVYGCILEKYNKKSVINLKDFTRLMTTNYPAKIKSMIMDQVKTAQKQKKDTPVKNYTGIREIRNEFFKIQTNVCTSMDPSADKPESEKTEKGKTCVQFEEADQMGWTCCRDESVPLDLDYWHVRKVEKASCKDTLKDLFKKWKIQESEMEAAMDICAEACKLKEEGVLTSASVEKMKIRTKKELLAEIRQIAPPYLSQSVLANLQNYSSSHNETSSMESHYSQMYQVSNNTIATLRPCIVVKRLSEIIYDGLYAHCFPQTKTDGPKIES